jgi:surface protein
MAPNNLRRFFINWGPHRSNLRAVSKWGTVPWSSMKQAFTGCNNFTITAPDVPNLSNVTDMSFMFQGASSFNQPIGHWNTTQVNNMNSMFSGAQKFNQPIGNWNTGKVNNMEAMFESASSFNQPIGNWNTGNVTSMTFMFLGASSFNQPIDNWNTGNVTSMSLMFCLAVNFNQYINDWNTSRVVLMNGMFLNATNFNQSLGNWDLSSIDPLLGLDNMLSLCGMDCVRYSATLIGWRAGNSTINGVILGADGRQYGNNAASARKELEFLQEWIFQNDSYIDTECLQEQAIPLSGTIPSNKAIAILEKEQPGADLSTEVNDYQELIQPEFKVFPNPSSSSNILHIAVSGVKLSPEACLRLTDMQGRIILQQALSNQTELQLNLLPSGIYLLEAKDGHAVWRKRVVITQ